MATLADLVKSSKTEPPPLDGFWHGVIVAPVPVSTANLMNVNIPDIDGHAVFKNCKWPKSALGILALGKEVLVVFDNRQNPWVIGVW